MHLESKSTPFSSDFSDVWVLPAALQQLQECGDELLVEELIEIFQTDTAARLEVLRQAVDTADYKITRTESHTIKGSALQVGAVKVADICLEMEIEARQAQPAQLAILMRALLRSFEEVRGVLATRRGSATDGSLYHGQ
jgi:HPt (histidine-containing phosphotransfer) domain-containing protein